jgi:WD40 repeat protein
LLGGVTVALAVSVGLAIAALLQRNTAIRERDTARSNALATAADGQRGRHLDAALLLGFEANRTRPTVEARSSMVSSLEAIDKTDATAILRAAGPVTSVAFSPDGKALAAGEENGDIRFWDMRSRKPEPGPPLHVGADEVTSVAFSRKRDLLTTGDKNLRLRIWNLGTRRPVGDAKAMPRNEWSDVLGVQAVSFSPDGRTVAGVDATHAMLWDVASKHPRESPLRLEDGDFAVYASLSADGSTLARLLAGGVDLWNVRYDDIAASNKLSNDIDAEQLVAVSNDRRTAANSDGDQVWLSPVGDRSRPTTVQPGHAGIIQAIAFAPGAHTLATGGDDDTVRLSEVPTRSTRAALKHALTRAVVFTPKGLLYGGGFVDSTRVWASRGPRLSDVRLGALTDLAFTPDGRLGIATGATPAKAQIWTVATGDVVHDLDAQPQSVAAFDPKGTRAVTGSDAGEARLWEVTTGELLHRLRGGDGAINSVAFSHDGKFVVTGAEHGRARLWATGTGKSEGVFDAHEGAGAVYSVAFSADGKHLVTGNGDGTARIWTVSDRRQVGEPLRAASHGYGVVGVAFSPDGRTLATGNDREQAQLWDVASHQPLGGVLTGDGVAFSRDGRSLAVVTRTISEDPARTAMDQIRIWKGILWRDADDLRARVCSLVWGNLTRAEWATYAPGLPMHATCAS